MMKSPVMRIVVKVTWLITGLAALNIGLDAMFGFNFFRTDMMMSNMGLANAVAYIIGLSGLVSLVMFGMACTHPSACGCYGHSGTGSGPGSR